MTSELTRLLHLTSAINAIFNFPSLLEREFHLKMEDKLFHRDHFPLFAQSANLLNDPLERSFKRLNERSIWRSVGFTASAKTSAGKHSQITKITLLSAAIKEGIHSRCL